MTTLIPLLAVATLAHGEPYDPHRGAGPRLHRVDPMVEDTGPLRHSQRLVPQDLRLPTSFDSVFRVGGTDHFARVDAGLMAIFPRSSYALTRRGPVAVIPADTRYVIGEPPEWLLRAIAPDGDGAPTHNPRRISERVDLVARDLAVPRPNRAGPNEGYGYAHHRADGAAELPGRARVAEPEPGERSPPPNHPGRPTPWGSDEDRGARVSSLVTRALAREQPVSRALEPRGGR